MPLEATHIRFALDLKNEYQVQDIEKYISGTIYPDSRYVTKINRDLTHNNDILKPEFAKDDFSKGWQVHQICDTVQMEMKKIALPEIFSKENDNFDEELWIVSTAVKIIQDIDDMQQFPIQEYLKYLEYTHTPNGENINDIKKYNQIIIDLYKNKNKTTSEDNYKMWINLGIEKELALKVKYKTEELLKDITLVKKIENIYNYMIENYKNVIKDL